MVCGLVFAFGLASLLTSSADARPTYFSLGVKDGKPGFVEMYPKVAEAASEKKCNVCHFGSKKSNRNDYGKAVGEALGGKDIKDIEKVKAALKKAEEGKSSVEGKTFGDLLNDGKLPGKDPE